MNTRTKVTLSVQSTRDPDKWWRVATVSPEAPLAELEEILVLRGIGRLAVTNDDGQLLGLVTRTDVLRQRNLYESV